MKRLILPVVMGVLYLCAMTAEAQPHLTFIQGSNYTRSIRGENLVKRCSTSSTWLRCLLPGVGRLAVPLRQVVRPPEIRHAQDLVILLDGITALVHQVVHHPHAQVGHHHEPGGLGIQ